MRILFTRIYKDYYLNIAWGSWTGYIKKYWFFAYQSYKSMWFIRIFGLMIQVLKMSKIVSKI